jgi:hypothetical protein
MGYSVFRNPFEALSAENQDKMVKSLSDIRDYFLSGNTIVESINQLGDYFKTFIKNQDKILDFLTKREQKQLSDKDQKEMVKTARIFGKGLQSIVDAVETFSKIPEDAVERFILSIEKIGAAFEKVSSMNKAIESGAAALMELGKSLFLFGALLILSFPVYVLAAVAAPLVIAVVAGLVWLFVNTVGKYITEIEDSSKYLLYMAGSIILFGLAIIVAAQLYGQILAGITGILAIYLVITMTVFFFLFISKYINDIQEGAKILGIMALVLLGFGLLLLLASLVYAQLWVGMLGVLAIFLTIAIVVGLMMLIDSFSDTIYDGVKALGVMVLIILAVGILLVLATSFYEDLYEGLIDSWPIFVVITALIGFMFLIDKMKSNIYQGALALVVMVAAVGLAGLVLYLISGYAEEMQAGLGASWPILVLLGALIGLMFFISQIEGQVLKGSFALLVISGAVYVLSKALAGIKEAGWNMDDTISLSALIAALGLIGTLLGAEMEAGMLPLLGAAAIGAIGLSLLPLVGALTVYKKSGFTGDDALNLAGLITVLALVGTVLGIPFVQPFILMGALAMGAVGLALVPFTESLLTFKKSGFGESDTEVFVNVLDGIITGLTDSFSKMSLRQMGKLALGIRALSGIGKIMTDLATGIQFFANMKFIEYEVVKNKDGIATIQPKSVTKLSDTDIINAGISFGKVIDAITDPLRKVGEAEAAGESWFSGGYISKGIKALTGIGGIMTGLAQGVQAFANMTFTTFKVVGTGVDAKIVPASIEKIDMDVVLPGVVSTFDKVVTAMTQPLYNVGLREGTTDGIFSDGYISKGIKALTGVGAVMTDLAKGVQGFANLTFQKYKLDEKSGKLVPDGSPQKMGETEITNAGIQFRRVIDAILDPIIYAGNKYGENEDQIDNFLEIMPKLTKHIGALSDTAKKLIGDDFLSAGVRFKLFLNGVLDIFKQQDTILAAYRFSTFSKNASILIDGVDKLDKVANSFERIADAFGEMKDHINGMELERLTQVTKMMGFLDGLANGNSSDIVADIGESITNGMETLKDILEEIKDQLGKGEEPGLLDRAANAIGIGPGTAAKATPAKATPENSEKMQGSQDVVTAINNLRTTLISQGIKVNNNFFTNMLSPGQ